MHGKQKPNSVTVNEYKDVTDYSIQHRVKSEMSRGEGKKKKAEITNQAESVLLCAFAKPISQIFLVDKYVRPVGGGTEISTP